MSGLKQSLKRCLSSKTNLEKTKEQKTGDGTWLTQNINLLIITKAKNLQ